MTTGGKNLMILGVASAIIAVATTGVSLAIYHNSGDIYLDRSWPGYLPDDEEIKQGDDTEEEYEFSKTGAIDEAVMEEYLENLEKEIEVLNADTEPFGAAALSDERLGIPAE